MRAPARPPKNPRPFAAFFLSLLGSGIVLGLFLLYDGRVVELKKARSDIQQLEDRIADRKRENAQLRAAINAANRGELPAEKTAREELHLVQPDDVVLLYPPGSLSGQPPSGRGAEAKTSPAPVSPTQARSQTTQTPAP